MHSQSVLSEYSNRHFVHSIVNLVALNVWLYNDIYHFIYFIRFVSLNEICSEFSTEIILTNYVVVKLLLCLKLK